MQHSAVLIYFHSLIILYYLQVLGDEKKRSQYDTWGSTGNPNNMGGPGGGDNFQNSWGFQSNVDAEELFRKIFNQSGFASNNSFEEDFADSKFGFGAAEEVRIAFKLKNMFQFQLIFFKIYPI